MAKSIKSIQQQHIHGNKGNQLVSKLQSKNLENVIIIPLEIGKSSHKALIANFLGSIIRQPFEFHNSREGIKFLHNTIKAISKEQTVEEILIGMEASGHYYKRPAAILNEMGYGNLLIINPLSTSYCRKAGLTWSKTDNIDLRAIGQGIISGYSNAYSPEHPLWGALKEVCRYRRFLVRQQTGLKNKIHCCFDLLLPGINKLEIFKDDNLWGESSLDFFSRYSDIEMIKRLKRNSIVKFFQRRGRCISSEAAFELIKWSKDALNPYSPADDARQFIFIKLIEQFKQHSSHIRDTEIKLIECLVQTPAVLLLSIDFIGPIRAAEFAGESAPIEQYPTSRALIKSAGLDSTRYQSASSESSKHPTSKKGSQRLRYITIEIADSLMKRNQHFALITKDLINRGKSEGYACVATASRFIRIAYWMLRDKKTFQPASGLGISNKPLEKIKLFLQNRKASDLVEKYIFCAKKFFP